MALFTYSQRKRYPVSVSNILLLLFLLLLFLISSLLKTLMLTKASYLGLKRAILLGLFYVYFNGGIIQCCAPIRMSMSYLRNVVVLQLIGHFGELCTLYLQYIFFSTLLYCDTMATRHLLRPNGRNMRKHKTQVKIYFFWFHMIGGIY